MTHLSSKPTSCQAKPNVTHTEERVLNRLIKKKKKITFECLVSQWICLGHRNISKPITVAREMTDHSRVT